MNRRSCRSFLPHDVVYNVPAWSASDVAIIYKPTLTFLLITYRTTDFTDCSFHTVKVPTSVQSTQDGTPDAMWARYEYGEQATQTVPERAATPTTIVLPNILANLCRNHGRLLVDARWCDTVGNAALHTSLQRIKLPSFIAGVIPHVRRIYRLCARRMKQFFFSWPPYWEASACCVVLFCCASVDSNA